MSFLFRRSKRGRKNSRNRNLPIGMLNDKNKPSNETGSATAGYPKPQSSDGKKQRTPSSKLANKSLVTKINDNPTNPIPDVIASHEGYASYEATNVRSSLKISEITNGNNAPSSSTFKDANTIMNRAGKVDDVKVQIHRPTNEISSNHEASGFPFADQTDGVTMAETDSGYIQVKRKSSITYSEKEALGTLDDVLRTFDDFDDNLNAVSPTEKKTFELEPDPFDVDPAYESVAELRESLADRDNVQKPNGVYESSKSQYNLATTLPQTHVENKSVPYTQPEAVYAKPIKRVNNASTSSNHKKTTRPAVADKPPVVQPKTFEVETDSHEVKFSPLKKSSPSASLSQSLNKTNWANANSNTSPKHKPMDDNNNNFSLRRGQLSGPAPINTDEDYVEPPPDYDMNGTLSSIGRSTIISDESFTRDTWGSLTSSSTASGSRKAKKEFRPEVLKMIEKRKAQQEDTKETEARQHDGLVNRSFRMIKKASLKETSSNTSQKEDEAKQSDIENDYTNIKSEADIWLANYERMRANSEGKKGSLKSSSRTVTNAVCRNENEQTSAFKTENGLPTDTTPPLSDTTQAVLNQTRASVDVQTVHDSSATTKTTTNVQQTTKVKPNEQNSSTDDEDLIRLMETGFVEEDSSNTSLPQPKEFGYVPRALRMSFGQSWDGIRKDRREWKSREMKQVTSHNSRKGGKSLSNRLDDQEVHLDMLF